MRWRFAPPRAEDVGEVIRDPQHHAVVHAHPDEKLRPVVAAVRPSQVLVGQKVRGRRVPAGG